MKKLLVVLTLFLCTSAVFSASNLEILNTDYSFFSGGTSMLTFLLNNTGDESASLILSELTGLSYSIYSAPNTIRVNSPELVVFEVVSLCASKGTSINFFANFTYQDSSGTKKLNSTLYTGTLNSLLNVTLITPAALSGTIGLESKEATKLSYRVFNPSRSDLTFNINASTDNSIYSKVLSFLGEYTPNALKSINFTLRPGESYVFSHYIRSSMSGLSGVYSVTLSDALCSYNKEYLIMNYQTITSLPGPGFNIAVADETSIVSVAIFGLLLLFFSFKAKRIVF
jgi:hypothetical protein